MARRAKVKLVSKGVRELLLSRDVQVEIEDRGDEVLARAQALCPVESGDLEASLDIRTRRDDRVVVEVGSDLPYALRIAAVTGFLTQALDGAGGRRPERDPGREMVNYTRRDGTTIRVTRAQAANYGRNR